jgi:hypothetical protein
MKSKRLMVIMCFLLAACSSGPNAEQIESTAIIRAEQIARATITAFPTQTPYPTYTPEPTIVFRVVVVVTQIVTPTPTPTPRFTPTDTGTPTSTPNRALTATARAFAQLIAPHGDGFYLVGVDIAPGLWRSNGTGNDCYWERLTRTGDIIDNHFGLAGGTVNISTTDFQFHAQDCGQWEYLGQ